MLLLGFGLDWDLGLDLALDFALGSIWLGFGLILA